MSWDADSPIHPSSRLLPRDQSIPVEEPTDEARRLVTEVHARFPNLDGPRVQRRIRDDRGIEVPVGQVNAVLIELEEIR